MTENKGGPVKPPVIDLSAREGAKPEGSGAAGAAGATARSAEPPASGKPAATESMKTTSPLPPPRPAGEVNGGSLALGIVGGGVLGLAAAYALAWAGLWPAPADPRVAELSQLLPQMRQVVTGVPDLQTAIAETAAGMDGLDTRIAALETAEPAPVATAAAPAPVPDLSAVEAQIATLTDRLDTLPAAPDGDGGGEAAAALRGSLDTLATQLSALETRIGEQEAQLNGMGESLAATQATVAAQPRDIGAAVRLPLVLSALETAFAQGRSFSAELDALRRSDPEMEVPQTLIDAAGTGLPRREAIERAFAAVLPAMLADRPADPDADWQEATLDWLRARLALRPVGDVEGDSPEALAGRLEAAIARGDYAAADELFGTLPAPMRDAAGEVPQMVAVRADAARLLETVRRDALTLAGESAS
ncbi:hypothetical protein VE25_10470 [Devosia geojensis]|uniref:Inner membrane protein n=1 Tax=Devosia geojensis TaxID=443610 RepID=A0A0F5FSQ8_9HYPH|nr:hypothetical protein [Devosia geojensis]KKB11873.1 hypothetical protein VE25_10470 [Devosia geojensis]